MTRMWHRVWVMVTVASLALGYAIVGRAHPDDRRDEVAGRTISYTGYLEEAGRPVEGAVPLAFELFGTASESDTTVLWSGSAMVPVRAGRFVVELGGREMPSLPPEAFSRPEVFVRVSVNGTWLGSRQRLGTARHAAHASFASAPAGALATRLEGAEATGDRFRAEGQVLRVDGTQICWGRVSSMVGETPVANIGTIIHERQFDLPEGCVFADANYEVTATMNRSWSNTTAFVALSGPISPSRITIRFVRSVERLTAPGAVGASFVAIGRAPEGG